MARHRDELPRLNIAPSLNIQQPIGFDGRQPMFSPALPTSLQHSFHPPYPLSNHSMQTPMQPFFALQPPPAPGRPTHHQARASIAHLAAVGIHPASGLPMTPLGGHFPHPSMMLGPGQPFGGPFPNRNRRQPSIGGPPKAPLGGPGRKHSPLPPPIANPNPAPPQKVKKITINLPKESVLSDNGESPTHPSWARRHLYDPFIYVDELVPPPELSTAEVYPPDLWRHKIPDTVDVFLPGKTAWDDIKQKAIEAKLEKLGVERGSGSSVPHIHAPHARAASISSPADPALLFFKLNKLQQSQASSINNSLSASPQPPFRLSPSPHQPSPRFITNRHGHSMSLAQPPSFPQPFYNTASPGSNPFGPTAVLGSDEIVHRSSPGPSLGLSEPLTGIHAPQGRVPVTVSSLVPPVVTARSDSRPDFIRGFGLDIPEEEEEVDENEPSIARPPEVAVSPDSKALQDVEQIQDGYQDMSLATEDSQDEVVEQIDTEEERELESLATAAQSQFHSRHVSRLSAALSLRSVGGFVHELQDKGPDSMHLRTDVDDLDLAEVVAEWTGSEDLHDNSGDDESIGEWSNPSDEERARQHRVDRRNRRRAAQQEQPRRLPNFPRPPDTITGLRRDDDVISNPSEEGHMPLEQPAEYLAVHPGHYQHSRASSVNSVKSPRPLPPLPPSLPHSRAMSGQFSTHDPAQAHSRTGSEQFIYPGSHRAQPSVGRETLNPFAKPFIFGARLESSAAWTSNAFSGTQIVPQATSSNHTRLPSFGKPLNVAAPEFKPGGFNFRLPAGVPTFPAVEIPRPLPVPPMESSPVRILQGREKRQRRGSSASVEEEGDSMQSFKFPPNAGSSQKVKRSAPSTPVVGSQTHRSLNPSAEPFTFAGFSSNVPRDIDPVPDSLVANVGSPEEMFEDDSTAKAENGDPELDGFTIPSNGKTKRAPIPLDFKHPVSQNTVPAGLFKALVNGDERTRRTVRSRLSSREIFDIRQPSLDDVDVQPISRNKSRLVTDPGYRDSSTPSDDVFGPDHRRRSSLPDALGSADTSISIPAMDLTARFEIQQYEQRLESLLDDKFAAYRHEFIKSRDNTESFKPSTELMITEVVSLFRAQLQESAARGLEDSQMDARGELDFELIKDIIQQGHAEARNLMRREISELAERLGQVAGGVSPDMVSLVEQLSSKTIQAVSGAISMLSSHLEATEEAPLHHQRALVEELLSALQPVLSSLRPEIVDYDYLTAQLTQAVKPHISQLIDLASDKRETASLIVDRILPLLPGPNSPHPPLDLDAMTLQICREVRHAIAPIDAFEIKEQVADLVVERLDSRLAVRDKTFNVDSIAGKVSDGIAHLLEPMQAVTTAVGTLTEGQRTLLAQNDGLSLAQKDTIALLSDLSPKLDAAVETLGQVAEASKLNSSAVRDAPPDGNILHIKAVVDALADDQKVTSGRTTELVTLHQDVLERLEALPETLTTATNLLHTSHAGLVLSHNATKRELEELRKLNTDYQVQVAKARGAHGQVRVEKDALSEKLRNVEAERDSLRSQVKELKGSASAKETEVSAVEARNVELEEALAQALARLQASDVATQANQERIIELEKVNRELSSEKNALRSKVDSLDLQVTFATRDKETAAQALAALQKQHDHLTSQQSHWDDLRHASEKIELLTTLIGQADNEELQELRRIRDRSKVLEGEHAVLQKRVKDQESKVVNSERAAQAARQSLAQAQQRSSDWEKRAKEYEGKLERTQTQLDQAEQSQAQLDADYSLVKLQLEEREADDRLAKDRENQLKDQVTTLEAKITRLQNELNQTKKIIPPNGVVRKIPNGNPYIPPRPDSRSSTIFGENRSTTPNGRMSSQTSSNRSETPPNQASVWDSMHAPRGINTPPAALRTSVGRYTNPGPTTPKARNPHRPLSYYTPSITSMPSPTPSTVSLAPTLDADGWYSVGS